MDAVLINSVLQAIRTRPAATGPHALETDVLLRWMAKFPDRVPAVGSSPEDIAATMAPALASTLANMEAALLADTRRITQSVLAGSTALVVPDTSAPDGDVPQVLTAIVAETVAAHLDALGQRTIDALPGAGPPGTTRARVLHVISTLCKAAWSTAGV